MTTHTIRLHRVLRTTPERVYRAFRGAGAMSKWLPPNGFTGKVHHMDAKVGDSFKMSFTNFTTGKSHPFGRISDLLKILLAYFTFSWKKELHVVAGDLSGTNDIAGSTRMVAWVDRGAYGLESEALGTGAMRVVGLAQRQGAAEGFCGAQFSAQAN